MTLWYEEETFFEKVLREKRIAQAMKCFRSDLPRPVRKIDYLKIQHILTKVKLDFRLCSDAQFD